MKRILTVGLPSFLAALLTVTAGVASADVKPGDIITAANIEQVDDLVSPGLKWIIRRGMRMEIVEPKRVTLPKAYLAATEQYSSQVKLADDGLSVENWVAGQPFPNIDTGDPDVAKKIMYNYEARWGETDDVDLRNFDADTGAIGRETEGMSVEKHFVVDHFKRMYFRGRLVLRSRPTNRTKTRSGTKSRSIR
jgi:hypothetical protein